MCMKDELDMSAAYKENIDQFEMHRKFLNEVFGLDQTLKMHVIKYHYVTYFKMMGQTLREVSDQYHEGVHYTHKNHERTGQCFTNKQKSSKHHTVQCLACWLC